MSAGWEPWPTTPAARGRETKRERSSGSGSGMAPPSVPDLTVADADTLDCGVCFLPLKPPIFQCGVGHVVCASCRDKLTVTGAGKCHVCGDAMGAGGYRRCHAMERVVDSVRGPCSNAPYGCDATPAYHGRDKHLLACPYAPCHCPAGVACGFAGSTATLLDHIKAAHGWPCLTETEVDANGHDECTLRLHDGFNFLVAACPTVNEMSQQEGATTATVVQCLLLLNLVRQPFARIVSVVWIDPRGAGAAAAGRPAMECSLLYSSWLRCLNNDDDHGGNEVMHHHQQSTFRVGSTNLSDGLPNPDDCFQFVLPNSVVADHDGDGLQIRFTARRIIVIK